MRNLALVKEVDDVHSEGFEEVVDALWQILVEASEDGDAFELLLPPLGVEMAFDGLGCFLDLDLVLNGQDRQRLKGNTLQGQTIVHFKFLNKIS